MIQRFRVLLGILVAAMFMGLGVAPVSAQPDAGRAAGGEYPQRVARVSTTIPCVSKDITNAHVRAVNVMVKADAEASAVLVRMNPAITRLPAVIAAAPSPMRTVFNLLLAQMIVQRDQLVTDGASEPLYNSIGVTTDSVLSLIARVPCT